ncbi:hypothetical protein [Streptococcus sp. UBA4344]|uniref:hypothetical protein n=1 Tax=Streptococcus sp. UBA4344 TaxID=1947564 RepID=UPI00257CF4F5|nr:hypothetical protein [Streptococcus sp. UBA4344]
MVVKKDMNSNGHRLLIQKLLVSIHYLTLFRDEIVLVEKTPSLLGASFSPNVVQSELGEILASVDALSKQEKLIKSTFWYDEPSFRLMNHSLDIVGSWVRGIDHVLEICESKSVFQAILGDNRQRVFGVLIDVFTSLRVTNLSIKEESEYPILVDPLQVVEYKKREINKAELMAKIDALVPRKSQEEYHEPEEEKAETIPELLEKELAKRQEFAELSESTDNVDNKDVSAEEVEESQGQSEATNLADKTLGSQELPDHELGEAVEVEETSLEEESALEDSRLEEVKEDEESATDGSEELEDNHQLEPESDESVDSEAEDLIEEVELAENPEKSSLESEDEVAEEVVSEATSLDEDAESALEVADHQVEKAQEDEELDNLDIEQEEEVNNASEPNLPEINPKDAVKQFRHYLFDHKGMVYVIDAGEDLKREIKFYNPFDRFEGASDDVTASLVILEEILDDLRSRKKEIFGAEGNLISEATEPIHLMVYGQNVLMQDSRFETLMSEIAPFTGRSDLHIHSYQAYK